MEPSPDRTTVAVVPYDPAWPEIFVRVASELRALLPGRALDVIHIGSTAVPGLAAKPVVDVALIVDDAAAESTYVPELADAGFVLVVREPDWYEHRMLQRPAPSINLHVYPRDCVEVQQLVQFRDWLRAHDDDRDLYARTKLDLAGRSWEHVQDYADAKSTVVTEILARASADGTAPRRTAEHGP
jgi:GrpB-like predicted nucleotidyltransferase (UPF0157 family)